MDLFIFEVACRIFERWRQENIFQYLGQVYALDALVDYQVEPANSDRDVPKRAYKALDGEFEAARVALGR